jgi:hypothetical protein
MIATLEPSPRFSRRAAVTLSGPRVLTSNCAIEIEVRKALVAEDAGTVDEHVDRASLELCRQPFNDIVIGNLYSLDNFGAECVQFPGRRSTQTHNIVPSLYVLTS